MKKITLLMTLLMLFSSMAFAQPFGRGQMRNGDGPRMRAAGPIFAGLNLTDEQKTKTHDLQLQKEKELTPLRAEMVKLRGELRLLKLEKNPNLKAINSKIDALSQVRTKIMKIRAKYQLKFKEMLTDEQKTMFDQHMLHKQGKKGHRGMGRHMCR